MPAPTSSAPPCAPPPVAPTVLLVILTDLSTDHRCFKWAKSLRQWGEHPVIYCDQPRHALGEAWSGFDVRILTRRSHLQEFLPVFAAFWRRLAPALWRTPARIWIALDAPPLLGLAFIGKLRRRTVIYDAHELFLETPMVLSRPGRRIFWWLWEQGGFALIARAVTVSPPILARLQQHHRAVGFYLLPNMPFRVSRPSEPNRDVPHGEIRLIFQGGLRTASGLPELFAALAERPACRLDIYGDGVEGDNVRAAARHEHLGERVAFHGAVPFESLPATLERAHLGVHLMQPVCGSFALTWANKIFDYVHGLCPVLLSDNPAHQSLLHEFRVGVTVDAFSTSAIGGGIDALLAGYPAFVAACRRAREQWHWEAFAANLGPFLGL